MISYLNYDYGTRNKIISINYLYKSIIDLKIND
jgi:hypothetical protein